MVQEGANRWGGLSGNGFWEAEAAWGRSSALQMRRQLIWIRTRRFLRGRPSSLGRRQTFYTQVPTWSLENLKLWLLRWKDAQPVISLSSVGSLTSRRFECRSGMEESWLLRFHLYFFDQCIMLYSSSVWHFKDSLFFPISHFTSNCCSLVLFLFVLQACLFFFHPSLIFSCVKAPRVFAHQR